MPIRAMISVLLIALLSPAAALHAQPTVIDACDSLDSWQLQPSDGVKAALSLVEGRHDRAIRLEYNFEAGAGYVILRRTAPLDLPPNYGFSFHLRGEGPPNNLEFKLVDPTGDNVWWVNRRAFQMPAEWQQVVYKKRQFKFAWGPSAGAPLERIGAIEFAVSASAGGKGSITIDDLSFEPLPVPETVTHSPLAVFSSAPPAAPTQSDLAPGTPLRWRSDPSDSSPTIDINFRQNREFGGLALTWDPDDYPTDYDVLVSRDGTAFDPTASVRAGRSGRRYVALPDGEGRALRVVVLKTSRARGVALNGLEVLPLGFSSSPNAMITEIARRERPGLLPRPFLGQQCYWTVVGVSGDSQKALISEDGAIEVFKQGFSIEPALLNGSRLITWADASCTQTLAEGYLPIPSVHWSAGDLALDITAFADGVIGSSSVTARYEVRNRGPARSTGALALAIRPFQVLPPWQDLNVTGGVSPIDSIERDDRTVTINKTARIVTFPAPTGFGASTFAAGDVLERLDSGDRPAEQSATDPAGLASGVLWYDFDLGPGESSTVTIRWPLHVDASAATLGSAPEIDPHTGPRLAAATAAWRENLNRVQLTLPPTAQQLANAFRSALAHILINSDGPALQPGSRTYERSWIRDGSLMSAALLATGHAAESRAFIDWYATHLYPSGKVPCVVDRRGPDPVPENDSGGEFIYAVASYYRATGDREFLERHSAAVNRAADYIEQLRNQRLTPEFEQGPPDKRAMRGLVPESISHEGYSAKPMHSYWDDFFTLKGLRDAGFIGHELGQAQLESRLASLAGAFAHDLIESLRLAMKNRGIDFLPGCVELGDFDATSTAIAVFPCELLGELPDAELCRTFDKYFEYFRQRRSGRLDWRDYTPYEVRLVGVFIRLGQPQRAHELLDYFLSDQRPADWNQWAEVVWRDPRRPGFIGDMPHAWVEAEFINSVRSLFLYEDGPTLVLGAGLRPEWVNDPAGVSIKGWPTEFGTASYSVHADQIGLDLELDAGLRQRPGQYVFIIPTDRPIRSIQVDGSPRPAMPMRRISLDGSPVHVRVVWDHP